MADVTLTYKGSTILSLEDSATKTIKTGGTFCEGDIGVSYVKPSGGGGEDTLDAFLAGTISGTYENSRITNLRDGAFYNCTGLTSVSLPACTSIGNYAFYKCASLTTASFLVCKTISDYAFQHCSKLTTPSFPACTTISQRALADCYNLTTASFPACKTIGSYAFQYCSKLTTVSFPTCRTIRVGAFQYCYKLLSLYLYNTVIASLANINTFSSTPISNYTTSTGGAYGSIFVKSSLLTSWKTATNWATYSSRFVGNG